MKGIEILKIKHIIKSYQGKKVLDLTDISLQSGEIYGLTGPNGAGKSTLMKIISALTNPDHGTIEIFGKKLNSETKTELLKNMGVFIEGPSYYENLTGAENMKIIQNLKGLSSNEIKEAIEVVGLQNQMNKKVKQYSLGMKQRLGLAMALAGLPPFMILDEPTNGLDPQGIKEIRDLIISLAKNKGITIMISSHILGEMEKMVDQIGIINRGNLLYQGNVMDFKHKFGSEIALKTSDNSKALTLLDRYHPKIAEDYLSIHNTSHQQIAQMIKSLISANIDIYRVYDISKSLEDLFIELTGKGSL